MHLVTWQLSATCCWASRGFQGNRSLSCRCSSASAGEPRFGPEGLTPAGQKTGAKVHGGTPKIESTRVEFGDVPGGVARAEPCGACSAPRAVSCLWLSPPGPAARPAQPSPRISHAPRLSKTTSQTEQQLQSRDAPWEFSTEDLEHTFETPFLGCV